MEDRRKGYQKFANRYVMEIMIVFALVIVFFLPEIIGLLEQMK
tara:strand:- start:719 stop:847 length:129 start_codon:yes stop_codon:yes gene_type:complete